MDGLERRNERGSSDEVCEDERRERGRRKLRLRSEGRVNFCKGIELRLSLSLSLSMCLVFVNEN